MNNQTSKKVYTHSLFTELDIHLFKEGKHFALHNKMGSHCIELEGILGTYFAVWAPNADAVAVTGNFCQWNKTDYQLKPRWDNSGIWEGFIPNIGHGEVYKYVVTTRQGAQLDKADPYARFCETPPNNASIIWNGSYEWKDEKWLSKRKKSKIMEQPMSVYEVHLGSWMKKSATESLSYVELAEKLVNYLVEMEYTHVELLPVMEHPYFPSWGYQVTGYFATSSRFGTPEEFKYLVDKLHENNIGVLLDWVPSHFPEDAFSLGKFDGSCLYEHEDLRKGFHPDWKSLIFNYGRYEVVEFLISNALFWLEEFHVDGLRVDAVASMLYLDYSREEGQWEPNIYGGNENLEAVAFLKLFNETVYSRFPDVITIAEESTSWTGVSRPTFTGGLGFGQKWMMGWMHDTLDFFSKDSLFRGHSLGSISFSMVYAFSENFMLPLSHDEVVHGKGSLIGKMAGSNRWEKYANLRMLYAYMYGHVGTKLLFMGSEFAQFQEWSIETGLHWNLLENADNLGIQKMVKELNHTYKNETALYAKQFVAEGFEWVSYDDDQNAVIAFLRKSDDAHIMVVCNFTPVIRTNYEIGVEKGSKWTEILNTDAEIYGGSGVGNEKITTKTTPNHGKESSISVTLPPLSCIYLKMVGKPKKITIKAKTKVVKKVKTAAKAKTTATAKAKTTAKAKPKRVTKLTETKVKTTK